jgi:hypothetical protein
MNISIVRFSASPRNEPPPIFVEDVVAVFREHERQVVTKANGKGLKSASTKPSTRSVVEHVCVNGSNLYPATTGIG